MLARRACLLVLVAWLMGFAGCGEDDSLTGVWTGAFRDSLGDLGGGSFTFTQQSGVLLQGSWQVIYRAFGKAAYDNSGTLSGSIDGNSIAAVMTSKGCSFALQAARSGNDMTGTYATIDCATPETGTIDLTKMP
jgi:hypothetical protein